MGKKGLTATSRPQMSVTIREASTGKKHTNAKSSLKLQHIKNLAVWASRDAAIPSLGAFFGHHLAASSEALGVPVDPLLFTCERCESMLHPGYNCTIRIEKTKRNKSKKTTTHPRNNIVYTCHFCSHRNMKRGTLSQPKVKPHPKSTASSNTTKDNITISGSARGESKVEDESADIKTVEVKTGSEASAPATPLTLLESKMKRRKRSSAGDKKKPECETAEKSGSKKRRRSWTSLKEIAETNENERRRKLMNLTVPFSML